PDLRHGCRAHQWRAIAHLGTSFAATTTNHASRELIESLLHLWALLGTIFLRIPSSIDRNPADHFFECFEHFCPIDDKVSNEREFCKRGKDDACISRFLNDRFNQGSASLSWDSVD